MKGISGNIFMDWIYGVSRTRNHFIHRIQYWLFKLELRKVAPDFDMLWQIADFINMLNLTYLYPNTKNDRLYTTSWTGTQNGFSLIFNGYTIAFTLYKENGGKFIKIEIRTPNGNKPRSSIYFEDSKAEVQTIHDEQLFINITDWLIEAVIELMDKYYYKK
jgi:hypothetical protein